MKPYVSLGFHTPAEWPYNPRAWKVGEYITSLTAALGLTPLCDPRQRTQYTASWYSEELSAEVRRRTTFNKMVEGWHQDGDLDSRAEMDHALVLWSSNTPVEIRWENNPGYIIVHRPEPFEIILIRNLSCHHRRPPEAPRVRWRFRQKVRNDDAVAKLFGEE